MFLQNAGFSEQRWVSSEIFIGLALPKIRREIFTTFHIPSKPSAQDFWFQPFRKVSVYAKEIIHKKIN